QSHDKSARSPRTSSFPYTTTFRSEEDEAELERPPPRRLLIRGRPLPLGMHGAIRQLEGVARGRVLGDQIDTLPAPGQGGPAFVRSEEHTSELESRENVVCGLLLEK